MPVAGVEIEHDPLTALAERLRSALSAFDAPVIALIDSPRWPSDCDCRVSSLHPRGGHVDGRHIDAKLRTIVRLLAAASAGDSALRLSLFPTPGHDYFLRCIRDRACKPHLRALGRQLFDTAVARPSNDGPRGGAIFTRFMLTGFAAYRALEALGVTACEAYPDLQFRLWRDDLALAPKSSGRVALANRSEILAALAAGCEVAVAQFTTMDQADAAVLALSACAALVRGAIALIEDPDEGCFAISLQIRQAASLHLTDATCHADFLTLGLSRLSL